MTMAGIPCFFGGGLFGRGVHNQSVTQGVFQIAFELKDKIVQYTHLLN